MFPSRSSAAPHKIGEPPPGGVHDGSGTSAGRATAPYRSPRPAALSWLTGKAAITVPSGTYGSIPAR